MFLTGQAAGIVRSPGRGRARGANPITPLLSARNFVPRTRDTSRSFFEKIARGISGYFRAAGNWNSGTFNNRPNNGNFWTSFQNDASNAWNRNLNYNNATLNRNNNNKTNGFSVRCVKDLPSQKIMNPVRNPLKNAGAHSKA